MILDLTSLAFNSHLEVGGGTPSWSTALGQGQDHKFTQDGYEDILIGMLYNAVSAEAIECKDGKGGAYKKIDEYKNKYQLAACFSKVFVNNIRISSQFILLLTKQEGTEHHIGRRAIKYAPNIGYYDKTFSNEVFFTEVRRALGISEDGCWFCYNIEVLNQDELHFDAIIIDSNTPAYYHSAQDRKMDWNAKIEARISQTASRATTQKTFKSGTVDISTKQKIYFGAPGTGKSHTIKEYTNDSDNKITTTFHPDTDYASFVGCYKPKVEDDGKTITYKFTPQAFAKAYVSAWRLLLGEPADILSADKESRYRAWLPDNNVAKAFKYYAGNIKKVDLTEYDDVGDIYDISDPNIIDEIINKQYPDPAAGKDVGHMRAHLNKYKAFLQSLEAAPVKKSDDKNLYLVIEEINRGNCAQIFGDLFQLLDRREDGFSDYAIDVDKDFEEYLIDELAGLQGYKKAICDLAGIEDTNNFSFSKIALPSNLSILATMNTSDQSLFPMDSAFKRRWDWEYMPINAQKVQNVTINIGSNKYSWSEFITEVNIKIHKAHDSEDKQLGPYFVKAKKEIVDGEVLKYISEEQFVSKVMFYLWYEVFKDEISNTIFKTKEKTEGQDKSQDKKFTFNELFAINPESKKSEVNQVILEKFLKDSLGMKPINSTPVEDEDAVADAESQGEQSALVAE